MTRLNRRTCSRPLTLAIAAFRVGFAAFAATFDTTRPGDLAPLFNRLAAQYHRATGKPFIAFVRELDATVPADRSDYRWHRGFQAAQYLARLDQARHTSLVRRTLPPVTVLAMVLRGALLDVPPAARVAYWVRLRQASCWPDARVLRLQAAVAGVRGLPLHAVPPRLVAKQRLTG